MKRVPVPPHLIINRDEDEANKDEIIAYAEKYLESIGYRKEDTKTIEVSATLFDKFKKSYTKLLFLIQYSSRTNLTFPYCRRSDKQIMILYSLGPLFFSIEMRRICEILTR